MKTLKEKFIVNKNGKKTEVILDINEYEELLVDLYNLVIIVERKDEVLIDHEVVMKNLEIIS
jgi:hypothetical protein